MLNSAEFVFEPLVNPTALEDKEKQQRALEIWRQVEEHHLEAIQSRLRDEWDKAKEPFEGLTNEDIEEAKNDFHLHTYWNIVADLVETAGPLLIQSPRKPRDDPSETPIRTRCTHYCIASAWPLYPPGGIPGIFFIASCK